MTDNRSDLDLGSCGPCANRCAGLFRRHRLAFFIGLILFGLGFLVLQAGWVLGVIAFFRTI